MSLEIAADVSKSIAEVERRIELRRARIARHADEMIVTARQRARPLALVGVTAVVVAGFLIGRGPRPASVRAAVGGAARTGFVAALAATLQAALRLGSNPLVRAAWKSFMRPRV